jgi:cyclophilin family peptidyl-prolyl cis-trans isomerase
MKPILIVTLVSLVLAMGTGMVYGKDNPVVVMETSEGTMEIELYEKEAPLTVQNFLWYVDNEFYDGLIFHRVIKDFMIQGGGFTPDMRKKAGNPPIENEAANGLANDKYTLAMARTGAVHSATSQFFINAKDNDFLNYRDNTPQGFGYCVFGKVIDGTDVVDVIESVPTGSKNGMEDVPKSPVVIKKVYRKEMKKDEKAKTEKSE